MKTVHNQQQLSHEQQQHCAASSCDVTTPSMTATFNTTTPTATDSGQIDGCWHTRDAADAVLGHCQVPLVAPDSPVSPTTQVGTGMECSATQSPIVSGLGTTSVGVEGTAALPEGLMLGAADAAPADPSGNPAGPDVARQGPHAPLPIGVRVDESEEPQPVEPRARRPTAVSSDHGSEIATECATRDSSNFPKHDDLISRCDEPSPPRCSDKPCDNSGSRLFGHNIVKRHASTCDGTTRHRGTSNSGTAATGQNRRKSSTKGVFTDTDPLRPLAKRVLLDEQLVLEAKQVILKTCVLFHHLQLDLSFADEALPSLIDRPCGDDDGYSRFLIGETRAMVLFSRLVSSAKLYIVRDAIRHLIAEKSLKVVDSISGIAVAHLSLQQVDIFTAELFGRKFVREPLRNTPALLLAIMRYMLPAGFTRHHPERPHQTLRTRFISDLHRSLVELCSCNPACNVRGTTAFNFQLDRLVEWGLVQRATDDRGNSTLHLLDKAFWYAPEKQPKLLELLAGSSAGTLVREDEPRSTKRGREDDDCSRLNQGPAAQRGVTQAEVDRDSIREQRPSRRTRR